MTAAKKKNTATPLTEGYDALRAKLPGSALNWLQALRDQGRAAFDARGLPTAKDEAWKYTNLNRLRRDGFVPAPMAPAARVESLPAGNILGLDAYRIVLVNGALDETLSDLGRMPEAVSIAGTDGLAREVFGQIVDLDTAPVAALNTAAFDDAVAIHVHANALLDKPIHIVSLGGGTADPVVFHPRVLVDAAPGSQVTLLESHVGAGGESYFSNSVVEIAVGTRASVRHYKLQNEQPGAVHIADTAVRLADDASYESFVLTLGAALARNEISVEIAGRHAECRLFGGYLLAGDQHGDHTTFIDHAAPESTSREVYKGVLDGKSRGVFQGKILVRKDSQKTDGHQLNQALLLSRGAEIDSKPELEIYADDVKCAHGATAGELDEEALFYLRARGIDAASARNLLIAAFIQSALEEMSDAKVREAMAGMIDTWLAGRLEKLSETGNE
jgi:Fe-S cluster assembly protein SufD